MFERMLRAPAPPRHGSRGCDVCCLPLTGADPSGVAGFSSTADSLGRVSTIDLRTAHPVDDVSGPYQLIDLFAGSGAFSLGLRLAGLAGRALMVDSARDCTATCLLNHRNAEVLCADVDTVDWSSAQADVVVGGPPCQGFSMLGRRDDSDPRNALYLALLACVELTRPYFVAVENVSRFLEVDQGAHLIESLRSLGYETRSGLVDAAAFGAPQRRKRALVMAARRGLPIPWPTLRHGKGLKPYRTVADAFALLPRVPDGENWHVSSALSAAYDERVRAIPPGGSRRDLPDDLTLNCWRGTRGHGDVMGRLAWSKPATTVRTEFHRPEKGRFLHPTEDRSISIREAARLQSFPDSYRFPDDLALATVARQVGNAVPVALARAVGEAIAAVRHLASPSEVSV